MLCRAVRSALAAATAVPQVANLVAKVNTSCICSVRQQQQRQETGKSFGEIEREAVDFKAIKVMMVVVSPLDVVWAHF